MDGVLDCLRASGGQLVTARLNDGLVARRSLEVDRGAPAASTVDTVSTRSANRLRAAIARATRGGVATPGILERVNLDDDRQLRARCRRDVEHRREAVLTRPLHRRTRTPWWLGLVRHAEDSPAVLRLADAGTRRQAEPLADLGRDVFVL